MPPLRQSDTDACPGALRLHPAADGLLARVRLPGGLLTGAQLRALRALAEQFGDGRLELTSRANVQLRAIRAGSEPALATRLRAAGLLPSITHDPVRNIAAPPLAGADTRALVTALDQALCADPVLAALPGKFLFAIGRVALAADVAAVPLPTTRTAGPLPSGPTPAATRPAGMRDSGPVDATTQPAGVPRSGPAAGGSGAGVPVFAVLFAGQDLGVRVGAEQVVPVLLAAAHAFLAEREAQRGEGAAAWRLRELGDGPARVAARLARFRSSELPPPYRPESHKIAADGAGGGGLVGALAQADGLVAVGALVPLGRLDGVQMKALEKAERLAVTTARGVLVADLPPEAAAGWLDELTAAGLAVAERSRWAGVTACAGRPGCAKSLADVRADAAAATRFVEGLPVHWVGCDRACGSPSGRHVRVEATGSGYAVTRRTRDGAVEPPGPAGAVEPPGLAGAVEPPGPAGAERPLGDAETALTASRSRAAGAQGCLDGAEPALTASQERAADTERDSSPTETTPDRAAGAQGCLDGAEPALTTSQERAAGAQGCLGGAETALITSPGRPGGGRDLGDVVAEAREP